MNILIITHSKDNPCITTVTEAIEKKGGKVLRFDTDKYPTEYMMSAEYGMTAPNSLRLKGPDFDIDLEKDIDAVWYRRISVGTGLPADMDAALRHPSIMESKRTLFGMKDSMGKFILDPFTKMRYTENKQLQLQLAREVGLEIPETLITNDADKVREFYQRLQRPLITKMQHSFAVHKNGEEHVVFTNELNEEDVKDLDGLEFCPMQFQEKVDKKLELRVTIVGDRVFTAAIDSSKSKDSEIDWRREGHKTLDAWVPYDLPADIEEKMLTMMDKLGLNYGAGDILLTHDDRYLFLEINPAGEFFWIDRIMDHQISDAIGDVLMGNAKRRTNDILTPFSAEVGII